MSELNSADPARTIRIHAGGTEGQQIYSAVNAAAGISSPSGVPEVVIRNVTLVGEKEISKKMQTTGPCPVIIHRLPEFVPQFPISCRCSLSGT